MTCGYYRMSSPVTALPMIMRWISDVPSKMVKLVAAWVPVLCQSLRQPQGSGVSVRQTPSHRIQEHRPIGARVVIADAVRYMSVDSCREPDPARLRLQYLARRTPRPVSPRTPRPRAVSAVVAGVGSNQRRLSHLAAWVPVCASHCGSRRERRIYQAQLPDPGASADRCTRRHRGRCPLYVRGQLSRTGPSETQMHISRGEHRGP